MKKSLVLIVFLLCLITAAPLSASPLYGGYNGESDFWVDVFFCGIDNEARWWVRIPVPIVSGTLRINFKYESTGVVSAEVVGSNIPFFSGGNDFLMGMDTSGLYWSEYYDVNVSGGTDSNGNTWVEPTFLDYLGTGTDNKDHLWGFVTYNLENIYRLKVGINLSFLIPEPEPSLIQVKPKKLPLFINSVQKEESLKLIHYLTALSLDDELEARTAVLSAHSMDLTSLLKFAEEKVFTQERREVIEGMMNGFINDSPIF
jgi:hypothetical protein